MTSYAEHLEDQMVQLAEIGAVLCGYAHTSEDWIRRPCDCKAVPTMFDGPPESSLTSEQTGCVEVRTAWRTLDRLIKARA